MSSIVILLCFIPIVMYILSQNNNNKIFGSKMAGYIYIGEVNELGSEQFVWMFGNVVESYKEAAIAVAEKAPFKNVGDLCNAFSEHLENLPKDGKQLNKLQRFIIYIDVTWTLNQSLTQKIKAFEIWEQERPQNSLGR